MKRTVGGATALSLTLLLAACATTPAGESGTSDPQAPIEIAVGSIAVAGDAPLLIAQQEGFFADEGLEVEIRAGKNFAAVLPLIQNGELQIGFSSAVPLMNASANGAPITVFAGQEYTDTDEDTATIAVMVPEASTLTRPRDLEGKNVGVVAKGNSDTLGLLASVAKDGGDPDKVSLLELGIGAPLLQGLTQGNVDAIVGGEPTRTLAIESGGRALFYPMQTGMPGLPQGAYFTSTEFAKASPEALKKFRAAIERASEFSRENPDEVRKVLPGFLNIEQELADAVRLPGWDVTFAEADWSALAKLGVEHDMVDKRIDVSAMLWDGS